MVNEMVMLPHGVKKSYGMKCISCDYKVIVSGEKYFIYDPVNILMKIINPPFCPKCRKKLIKDESFIIMH